MRLVAMSANQVALHEVSEKIIQEAEQLQATFDQQLHHELESIRRHHEVRWQKASLEPDPKQRLLLYKHISDGLPEELYAVECVVLTKLASKLQNVFESGIVHLQKRLAERITRTEQIRQSVEQQETDPHNSVPKDSSQNATQIEQRRAEPQTVRSEEPQHLSTEHDQPATQTPQTEQTEPAARVEPATTAPEQASFNHTTRATSVPETHSARLPQLRTTFRAVNQAKTGRSVSERLQMAPANTVRSRTAPSFTSPKQTELHVYMPSRIRGDTNEESYVYMRKTRTASATDPSHQSASQKTTDQKSTMKSARNSSTKRGVIPQTLRQIRQYKARKRIVKLIVNPQSLQQICGNQAAGKVITLKVSPKSLWQLLKTQV